MKQLYKLLASIALLEISVLLFGTSPLVTAKGDSVTLNPTDDTYVDSSNPDSNYGGQDYLYLSKYKILDTVFEKRIWLKFDLSRVPDGALVDWATLWLYEYQSVSETYNVSAYCSPNNSWTELTLTYSNMPDFNATPIFSVTIPTGDLLCLWSVTEAVKGAIDDNHGGSDVLTIVLQETATRGSFSGVGFLSKERMHDYNSSYSYCFPHLTVYWTGIVPEFRSLTILTVFIVITLLAVTVYRRKLVNRSIVDEILKPHFK